MGVRTHIRCWRVLAPRSIHRAGTTESPPPPHRFVSQGLMSIMSKQTDPKKDGGESSEQARRTYYLNRLLSNSDNYLLPSLSRKRKPPGCNLCAAAAHSDSSQVCALCSCPGASVLDCSPKQVPDSKWNRGLHIHAAAAKLIDDYIRDFSEVKPSD